LGGSEHVAIAAIWEGYSLCMHKDTEGTIQLKKSGRAVSYWAHHRKVHLHNHWLTVLQPRKSLECFSAKTQIYLHLFQGIIIINKNEYKPCLKYSVVWIFCIIVTLGYWFSFKFTMSQ
jgi:hypothetical protein